MCLLSRLWEGCLEGAGELMSSAHTMAGDTWCNPQVLKTGFLSSSVSGCSGVGHCPDFDCDVRADLEHRQPNLWECGKGAAKKHYTLRLTRAIGAHWCLHGASIFLVDLPGPHRGVFGLWHGFEL